MVVLSLSFQRILLLAHEVGNELGDRILSGARGANEGAVSDHDAAEGHVNAVEAAVVGRVQLREGRGERGENGELLGVLRANLLDGGGEDFILNAAEHSLSEVAVIGLLLVEGDVLGDNVEGKVLALEAAHEVVGEQTHFFY